ncbi:putative aldehyde dehydrogenase [Mariannaea sp. PMI_226]|nr:putative aldehyde dehydrogenase [Mariannaea sp. PMI_226]
MGFSQHDEIDEAYSTVKATFASHKTKSLEWRVLQLQKVWWMLEDNKDRIVEALYQDLHKHKLEALSIDVSGIQTACLYTLKHLKSWTSDDKPNRFNALNFFGGTRVRKEPKGTALILSAWNYPFMELFEPMICAIAAGCSMVLKPSEVAVASQNLIQEIVPKYLDQDAIRVVTAGPSEMGHILQKRWDHIFFTGSTTVGRLIYEKAASHLTSVTLELGGQGPAIVSAHADVDLAAKRIAAAKFLNAGQVCLTVNHIFVDPAVKEPFISSLVKYFDQYLKGSDGSPDHYSHIINDRNFNRLDTLLQQTSGTVIYGGQRDPKTRRFLPTIVDNVTMSDSLMSEELFGPILPILDATLDESIQHIVKNNHPLALYPFTTSAAEKDKVLRSTASGGVTINDVIVHMITEDAPFGGTGHSGMGAYHGQYGFREFTHFRTVVDVPKWLDMVLKPKYPPYTEESAQAMSKIFRPVDTVWFDRDGRRVRSRFQWIWSTGDGFFEAKGYFTRRTRISALGN